MENIKKILGFSDDKLDTDVYAEVTRLVNENKKISDFQAEKQSLSDQLVEKDNRIAELESSVNQSQEDKVKIIVEAAVKEGRITEDQKEAWGNVLKGNFDEGKKVLEGLQPYESVTNRIKGPGSEKKVEAERKKELTDEWDRLWKSKEGLSKLKKENFSRYEELFEAKFGKKPNKE